MDVVIVLVVVDVLVDVDVEVVVVSHSLQVLSHWLKIDGSEHIPVA